MVILIQLILFTLASLVIYYGYMLIEFLLKVKKIGRAVDQFEMDKKHWLRGHLDLLSTPGEEILSFYLNLMKKYPKACGLYYFNFLRPYVVVYHPDTVKIVLKASGGKPHLLGSYGYAKRWFGCGLVLSNGNRWIRSRKLITPAFHLEALKPYIKTHNHATESFLNNLSLYARSNKEAEVQALSSLLAFDIILQCALSYENGLQNQGKSHFYIKAVGVVSRLWVKRMYQPLKHFDFIYWWTSDGKTFLKNCEIINGFADNLIRERRALIAEDSEQTNNYYDFLDILVRSKDEDGVGLTDEEIRYEINSFIAAGYESSAGIVAWTLYSFASNPNIQKKCQFEIDELMEGRANDYLSWDDLQKLPYLTMCIKESMRLYTFPTIEKILDEDVVIDNKTLPKGSIALICLFALHRNPEFWVDPLKFDPERFSNERKPMDNFTYIPFSAGSRNCIGQTFAMDEIKVILARTLKRYDITPSESHKPIKRIAITLRSTNGIYLNFSERH